MLTFPVFATTKPVFNLVFSDTKELKKNTSMLSYSKGAVNYCISVVKLACQENKNQSMNYFNFLCIQYGEGVQHW